MALLDAQASAMYANMSQYHRLMEGQSHAHHASSTPTHHPGNSSGGGHYQASPPGVASAHPQVAHASAAAAQAAMAAFTSRFSIDDISVGRNNLNSSGNGNSSANSSGADLSIPETGSSPPSSGGHVKRRSSSDSLHGAGPTALTMSLKVEPQFGAHSYPYSHPHHSHHHANHQLQQQTPDSSTAVDHTSSHNRQLPKVERTLQKICL